MMNDKITTSAVVVQPKGQEEARGVEGRIRNLENHIFDANCTLNQRKLSSANPFNT